MLKVAAGTHLQHLALQADGPPALVPVDPGVPHIDSFAKYAVAGSTGGCNTRFKFTRWRVKPQGLPWTLIQS